MALVSSKSSVLVVVDLQPTFLRPIGDAESVVQRTRFLAECARILGVPIVSTVQNAERMGGTHPALIKVLGEPIDKMSFSCCGSEHFLSRLRAFERNQIVLAGIETHICVNQTTHDLLSQGMGVFLASDAISARPEGAHQIGMMRMQNAGAIITHSESIVYEWMQSADNPQFREILKLVKEYA